MSQSRGQTQEFLTTWPPQRFRKSVLG